MYDGSNEKEKELPQSNIRGLTRSEVIERMRERLRRQQEAGPPRKRRCACDE